MTCQKVPYEDRAAALADVKQVNQARKWRSKKIGTSPKSGRKLRPYACFYCGKWHLTTQPKRKK